MILDVVLDFLRHLELRHRLDADTLLILVIRIVEDLAGIIDDRDILRGQALNAVCHEVDNAFDFLARKLRIRLQAQHDRCRSRFLILLVKAVLRQDDMHTSLLYGLDLLNRARELPLDCLQVVDLVLELRNTELAVVKNLEALLAARQVIRRHGQTLIVNLIRRYEDRGAVLAFLHLVIDLILFQFCGDLTSILGFHVRKQGNHIRFAAVPETDAQYSDEERQSGAQHDIALAFAEFVPELLVPLFPISHAFHPFTSCFARIVLSGVRPACA